MIEKKCPKTGIETSDSKLIWKPNPIFVANKHSILCYYHEIFAECFNKSYFTTNRYIVTVYLNSYNSLSSQNKHKI